MENINQTMEMTEINQEMDVLKNKKNKIKKMQERKSRLRSNNTGKSNVLGRVSINFRNRLDYINEKREENGYDCLSYPKITELMVKHKKNYPLIERDIIRYNTGLDEDEEEAEFNEK